jgi:protein SCO1/2
MSLRHRGAAARNLLLLCCAVLAAGAGAWYATHRAGGNAGEDPALKVAAMKAQLRSVRLVSPPRALPDWKLRLSDGGEATPATLQGHWTLVFLGFTHCPDVCPTTLQALSVAQKQWDALPAPKRPRLLFVSVDPERDTPKIVGDYAHYFHPATLASSPTPAQLAAFAQALGLVYLKVPQPDGNYDMDHSATLVVLDPQGRQAGLLSPPLDPQKIADDLRLLAERAP